MPDPANEFRNSAPNCPSLEQLDRFYFGVLSGEEAAVVAQHLAICPVCAAAFEAATVAETPRSTHRPVHTPHSHATPAQFPQPGEKEPVLFGKYRLVRKIAEGGMGVVYEAVEEPLQRTVALKLVRCGMLAGESAIQRFRTEAQAVARLDHPHIVRIYDYGEYDGAPYFSMELMAGGSLADKLHGQPQPEREAAQMVETLARAVQFAHEHQVLHRDLKPGNVLLAADGTVKLSDFGLAKLLDVESGQTHSDAVLGTPSYMSPEQASGDTRKVDVGSDVYSLGAILYELLTGCAPFRGQTRAETLEMVRAAPPRSPAEFRKGLTPSLEAICLKCLEKEPADRYPSAEQLAERLRSFLDGKPMMERPPRWPTKAWRSLRRRPRPAVGSALLFLVIVASLLAGYTFKAESPRDPKPEDARAELAKQIKAGHAYEFRGTEALPGPWRVWSPDVGGNPTAVPEEACFKIAAWGTALVELTNDPACDRYRLSFEVRHDDGSGLSHVGVYFAGRDIANVDGDLFRNYYSFSFTDRRADKGATEFKGKAKLRYCCAAPDAVIIPSIQIKTMIPFTAAEPPMGPGPWRKIALEVTPDGVTLRGPDPAGVKTIEASADELCRNQAYLADAHTSHAKQKTIPVEFRQRGGIGLFVVRGTACFKNIVLEPLPDKN